MFGNLGNLGQMKGQMEAIKEKLDGMMVEGNSGNGRIVVKMNGNSQVKDISIDDNLLSSEHKEELQDLLVMAFEQASARAMELNQKEMKEAANSMFPGLGGMMG